MPPTFGLSGINLNFESDKIPASPLDVGLPFLIIGFDGDSVTKVFPICNSFEFLSTAFQFIPG